MYVHLNLDTQAIFENTVTRHLIENIHLPRNQLDEM